MKKRIAIAITFFLSFLSFSQQYIVDISKTPEMKELSHKDTLFRQFSENIEENNKLLAKGSPVFIGFYKYKCKKGETLFTLAARLSLRQETLATLNRIETPSENLSGKMVVVPDANGLFVPEKSELSYEIIIKERIMTEEAEIKNEDKSRPPPRIAVSIKDTKNRTQKFDFYLDEKLGSAERAYFLDSGMHLPLEKSIITSTYGYRTSPISGNWLFHKGIDLAASTGSSVFSCKNGRVKETGFSEIYGNYIVITHDGGKSSLYAHLSKILVQKGDIVSGGKKIGEVGSTGLATGPHLHFEFSENGKLQNPQNVIKF